MRSALTALAIICACAAAGVTMTATAAKPAGTAVRVWEDSLVLPTYEEGPPDVNAPFDLLTSTRFNYPYTLRTTLTTNRAPRRWRTLNVENEYLRCVILPGSGRPSVQLR